MITRRIKRSLVRQQDECDCGIACLATVISYFGGYVPLENIRQLSGSSKTGTTLLGLYQASNSLGLEAEAFEIDDIHNLFNLSTPVILHLKLDTTREHYVVCYHSTSHKVIIGDPSKGVVAYSIE